MTSSTGGPAASLLSSIGAMASLDRMLVEAQKAITSAHRAVLQRTGGRALGRIGLLRNLVLHTTGRKSGTIRQTPLSYTRDGDAFVVIASDGGAPGHPDWYLNLLADPACAVEVDGRSIPARAETVEGADRDRLWQRAARAYPGYLLYQLRTQRRIPVVRLVPRGEEPAPDG